MTGHTFLNLWPPGWEKQGDDILAATTEIYGVPYHVVAIRVRYVGESKIQEAVPAIDGHGDSVSFAEDGLLYAQKQAEGCVHHTEIPGFDGTWVITIYPFGY